MANQKMVKLPTNVGKDARRRVSNSASVKANKAVSHMTGMKNTYVALTALEGKKSNYKSESYKRRLNDISESEPSMAKRVDRTLKRGKK